MIAGAGMALAPALPQLREGTMPTFKYLGLPESQRQNMIDTMMAPLENDEKPHPRFGGFPQPGKGMGINELEYYPDYDKDRGSTLKIKEAKREAFRKQKLEEITARTEEHDAMMAYTVGRDPAKKGSGTRIEFPKGVPVEVSERWPELIKQLRALCGENVIKKNREGKVISNRRVVDVPLFAEVSGEEEQEEGPPWGDAIPTKEQFVDYYESTMKKDAILAMGEGLDPAMKKSALLEVIYAERYEAGD